MFLRQTCICLTMLCVSLCGNVVAQTDDDWVIAEIEVEEDSAYVALPWYHISTGFSPGQAIGNFAPFEFHTQFKSVIDSVSLHIGFSFRKLSQKYSWYQGTKSYLLLLGREWNHELEQAKRLTLFAGIDFVTGITAHKGKSLVTGAPKSYFATAGIRPHYGCRIRVFEYWGLSIGGAVEVSHDFHLITDQGFGPNNINQREITFSLVPINNLSIFHRF